VRTHIIATKGSRQWQGIPAIERAANGRLWSAFFTGGPKEPDPANCILLSTSADDGVTWSAPTVVVDPPGATRAYDPALWHDPTGRLWLFYNLANLETRDYSVWAMTATDSDGPTPHWGAPVRIPLGVPFAFRLNKPTVLSTGEWVLPVTWAPKAPEGWFAREGQLQGVAITADGGATWTFHGGVKAPPWALENMVVERRDGSLWMLIRTGSGVLWQSTSRDGGRTWSEGSPTSIVNPGSRFFIRRLASGRLLLINTPDPSRRTRLLAYLMDDDAGAAPDGAGLGPGLELDGRDNVSYPDAVQAADGTIYAVHDCERHALGEIVLNVFTEGEIPTSS
jgi:predicted neuraminidase